MSKVSSRSRRKPPHRPVAHFAALTLSNFRSFHRETTIPLAPLTIIVGPNSSGKSSLMQALLFLVQSKFTHFWGAKPIWTGPFVDLGSFDDTVYGHNKARKIVIDATISNLARYPVRLRYGIASSLDAMGILSSATISDTKTGISVVARRKQGRAHAYTVKSVTSNRSKNRTSRIIAERKISGSGDSLLNMFTTVLKEMSADSRKGTVDHAAIGRLKQLISNWGLARFALGTQRVTSGRLPAARWYARGADDAEVRLGTFDRVDPSLLQSVDRFSSGTRRPRASLQKMMARMGFSRTIKARNLSAYHTAIQVDDFVTGISANLVDVGYGISQAVPILRALTQSSMGPLLVEQPEIHLHPSAQGEIAELLCQESKQRQVVIETHSERIVNRARILIARGEISASDVAILYVDKRRDGAVATPIRIDSDGNFIDKWPNGFFEERFEDTMTLLSLQEG